MIIHFVLTLLLLFIFSQITIRLVWKNLHLPAPAFIGGLLDSNWRRTLQPPGKIIERSMIIGGMTVLEIGCGSGAYTTHVARSVMPGGRICALDIQKNMLDRLVRKLRRKECSSINNIDILQASAEKLPFPDETFDLVYMVTVLQEIPDKMLALRETKRVLKKNGIMSVTEFFPDPDFPLPETTRRDLEGAGFNSCSYEGNLWNYTAIAKKQDTS